MLLLDTEQPVTFEQIVEHGGLYPDREEAARKSFERDKAVLRSLGVTIRTPMDPATGTTRYIIEPDDYFLADLGLDEAEQLALQLAASVVRLDESWDDQAIAKIGGTISAPPMVVAELPSLDQLPVVHAAIRDRAPLVFEYSGKSRTVEGLGLFYREGNWYLNGRDDGIVKTFRIDRISGTVRVGAGGSYEIAGEFDPGAAMPRDPMLIGEGEVVSASVWIDPATAARIVRLRGVESVLERRDDGSVVVEVLVRNRNAFRSWVLGLRHHAEVLGPSELRDDLVSWLEAMAGVG